MIFRQIFSESLIANKIALTTYKQSQEILKYFEELGIKNISVKYSGWMKDGVSNRKLPSKVTYCGKLGSKKDFKKLNDAVSSNGGNTLSGC